MAPPEMPDAVFQVDGERFVPTALARGPWDPNAQHGGPPAALLARAIERFEPSASSVVRMTIELLRPVPMTPLVVRTRMLRPGTKVQLVEAAVVAGETEVVRCTALRIRSADVEFPPPPRDRLEPGPGQPPTSFESIGAVTFGRAMQIVPARGVVGEVGPAAMWFRLVVPVVAGEPTSPLMRVAAAADFGNGISAAASWDDHLFINPDLTIYLHRLPEGDWIGLDAVTWPTSAGAGVAESALYDESGRIGRAVQALLLDRR